MSFLFYFFATFVEKTMIQASAQSSLFKDQYPILVSRFREFSHAILNDKRSLKKLNGRQIQKTWNPLQWLPDILTLVSGNVYFLWGCNGSLYKTSQNANFPIWYCRVFLLTTYVSEDFWSVFRTQSNIHEK